MEYYNLNYLEKSDLNGLINNENNYKKYIVNKIIEKPKITEGYLNPIKILFIFLFKTFCKDFILLISINYYNIFY